MSAGPAPGREASPAVAVPIVAKMPAPMMAPMPSAIRFPGPRARRSCWFGCSVSATSASRDFVRKSPDGSFNRGEDSKRITRIRRADPSAAPESRARARAPDRSDAADRTREAGLLRARSEAPRRAAPVRSARGPSIAPPRRADPRRYFCEAPDPIGYLGMGVGTVEQDRRESRGARPREILRHGISDVERLPRSDVETPAGAPEDVGVGLR